MSVDQRSSSGAAQRVADTLLRVLGGTTVSLRVTEQPATGDAGQVGMPGAIYQDFEFGPVMLRRTWPGSSGDKNTLELLVPASSMDALAGQFAAATVEALFLQTAAGVVVDGDVKQVTAVKAAEAFGAAYLYSVSLCDA